MKWLKKSFRLLLFTLILFYIAAITFWNFEYPTLKWSQEKFEEADWNFPDEFLWGTATAAHQVEGNNTNNNWFKWEQGFNEKSEPNIHNNDKSGIAADHWNRYPKDIQLMKAMSNNAYRFSVEWSKIEPTQGHIDAIALQHYSDLVDSLLINDITPMVTFHHFTQPIWFDDLGGFEREENIKYFVNFCKIVFQKLADRVEYFCTINEPNVFITGGYVQANFPPGKKDPQLAGEVLLNLLKAHTNVYRTLKATRHGNDVKIGIVKDIFVFEPKSRWNPLDWLVARSVDAAFNESTLSFLRTGIFDFKFPGAKVKAIYPAARGSYDFAGLNYYSHIVFDWQMDQEKALEPVMPADEIKTDMNYTIYPEGLYLAIERIAKLEAPIIITENGLGDRSDKHRAKYINDHLLTVQTAINDGFDIDGYFYWSLMDNFEWAEGYSMKFGLYELDLKTQERTLREGAKAYKQIIEASKSK